MARARIKTDTVAVELEGNYAQQILVVAVNALGDGKTWAETHHIALLAFRCSPRRLLHARVSFESRP